ncbi:MAG TPA: hypothetical protein V6C81_10770 [Planktothrix sp.]|jgi:hypothetical protein
MKINFLIAATAAMFFTGGTALSQQSPTPPAPAASTSDTASASADVCVIGVKLQAGAPPGAPVLPPGAVPAPVETAPKAVPSPAVVKRPQPQGQGKSPGANADKAPVPGKEAQPKPKDLPDEVSESCLNGQIVINVSSRPYGYKIGDVAQIEMEIILKGGALVDLDPLRQGKLAIDEKASNQFEVAGKPFIRAGMADGDRAFDIVVPVRTFVPSPAIGFSMQIPYAEAPAAGASPVWKTLSTPEYTLLQYIEDVKGFKAPIVEGNVGGAVPRMPAAIPPLTAVATILLLTWPVMLMLRYVNRVRKYEGVERRAAAWLALQRVIRSGKELGYGDTHYRRMAEVLRKYLRAEWPGLEGMTLPEIEQLPESPRSQALKSAFRQFDRVLIEGGKLSTAEQSELIETIDLLVERPLFV